MDETDDAAHLQSMLEDFSDGELVEDLLPNPPSSKVEVESTAAVNEPRQNEVSIYVGNLAFEITEKLLMTLFSEFGPIRTIEIVQSSEVCQFAFITYYNHADANAARFMNGKNYLGRKLIVNWKRKNREDCVAEEQNSIIWVGDLDKEVTNKDLREAFSPFGEIVTCNVVTDGDTSESRGFGFVSFANCEDAEMAIETMQGQWIKSKVIKTSWARKIKNRVRDFERKNILFLKGVPRYETYVQCQQTFDTISNQTSMNNRTIFVGGLSSLMLNRDMLNITFGQFGIIEDIKLCNRPSPEKPGYAFIMFGTKESACNAIMCMHNKVFEGNDISLKVAWGKEKYDENYEENYPEAPPAPTFEFGGAFEDFQRTVQGYGCPPDPCPGPPVPVPLQYPHQQPGEPCMSTVPSTVVETVNKPTPEEEAGYHAFSYYGTYVYQEKVPTEEEETSSSSESDDSRPAATLPQPPPLPKPPAEPKPRLKSVAKIKTEEIKPVKAKRSQELRTKIEKVEKTKVKSRSRSRSHSRSTKRKIRTRKRVESYSSSSSSSRSRTRTRSRSRSRYRRSHERSRSRSRSRSFSDRRSRPRSRSFDSGPERRRRYPVKSRIIRRKHKLPFILPNHHHPPTQPTFNHNIHAINQSTILSFPAGPSNYQQQYQQQPPTASIPQGHLPLVRLPAQAPISYGPPELQPTTFLNPPVQQVQAPPPSQRHQCYVNPHFIHNNQLPLINHHQEYNQSYTIQNYQHQQNPNIPPNFVNQNQFQFHNEPNTNYSQQYSDQYQYHPPVYDNNYYHFQSGPRFNNNITYYPPK